jgi:hypothetical protein
VASGRYEVLDRSNVDQVLTEKEFQLSSGLVKPEEARQAGEYLGAGFAELGSSDTVILAAAYFFSLLPKVGLTANAAFDLGEATFYSIDAGAFFTPFPMLLFRIRRLALGAGVVFAFAGDNFVPFGGIGFCFQAARTGQPPASAPRAIRKASGKRVGRRRE